MPKHAVVDGSNIATEGRSDPSLAQLREAVAAFEAEFAFDIVTVIVDASFEHRVAKSERRAARAAIDANEIITPPAGVIGRGDTFILEVANRADAVVLSNDSFQEFHGTFSWLFDDGRLIGGKPIPGVGWVYVPRAPVRGPVSRRARAKADEPKPPAKKAAAKRAAKKAVKKVAKAAKATRAAKKPRRAEPTGPGANHGNAFTAFRKRHPLGSRVKATVEEFSSHGAYAKAGDVTIYLPLRLMADPAPRRARDVVTVGEARRFIIHRYDEERQGIDAGIIPFTGSSDKTDATTDSSGNQTPRKGNTVAAKKAAKKATKKSAKKAPARKAGAKKAAKKAPAKKAPARKAAKKTTKKAAKKAPAKKAPAKRAAKKTTKKAAKKAPAKKAPAKKAGAKKAAKKAPAKKARKAAKKRR